MLNRIRRTASQGPASTSQKAVRSLLQKADTLRHDYRLAARTHTLGQRAAASTPATSSRSHPNVPDFFLSNTVQEGDAPPPAGDSSSVQVTVEPYVPPSYAQCHLLTFATVNSTEQPRAMVVL